MELTKDKKLFLVLLVLIIFSLAIRLYHINFPSIGYHNMKENEFISIAKNMLKTKDFFSRYVDFHYGLEKEAKKIGLFPGGHLLSYQIIFCSKVFGKDRFLGCSRIINILFFIIALIFMYKIITLLTLNKRMGLLSAFILSILPLSIFFSRNLQPESPAFLFMLIGIYYYFLFIKNLQFRYLIYSGISAIFIFLYKLTFLICYLPFLFIFPYAQLIQKFSKRDIFKNLFFPFFPLVSVVLLFVISGEFKFEASEGRLNLLEIFTFRYWANYGKIILHYIVRENYTIFYTFSTIIGLIFVFFSKKKSLLKRYIIGWCIALVIYLMFLSDYINQHSYYQMPFLFLVAFCSAYFLENTSLTLNRFFFKKAGYGFVIAFLILSLFSVSKSVKAAYKTVFFGEDIVGEFLNERLSEEERFFIYTWCQGFGVCIYADRRCGWPKTLEIFKLKEREFDIRYIVIYPFSFFKRIPADIRDYINKNYRIVHIGFLNVASTNKVTPYTLVLKKGGIVNFESFYKNKKLILKKSYRIFGEKIDFYVIEEDQNI
jgi:4-amino-4-deoxy-L-arabinose transferase-like glycosyltransferase